MWTDCFTVDTVPPSIFNCPPDISKTTELGTFGVPVFWSVPFATDYSSTVASNSSHRPGDIFRVGSTGVFYQFIDDSLNKAVCSFNVIVVEGKTQKHYNVGISNRLLVQ